MNDSDSDDDDVLLQSTSFSRGNQRSQRTEENKKRKQNALIDDAISETNRQIGTIARIVKIKQEGFENNEHCGSNDDDMKETTAAVAKIRQSMATQTDDRILSPSRNDSILSRTKQEELQEAFDIELSSCWGLREVIRFDIIESTRVGCIFKTDSENDALKLLEGSWKITLADDPGNIRFFEQTMLLFRKAAEYGCLDNVLKDNRLYRLLERENIQYLPSPVHTWLVIAASSVDSHKSLQALGDAACSALKFLYARGKIIPLTSAESIKKFLDLIKLWTNPGTPKNNNSDWKYTLKSIGSLANILSIWDHDIQQCIPSSIDIETTILCLTQLNRISLDTCIQSNQDSNELERNLQNARLTLLHLFAGSYGDGSDNYVSLIKSVAQKSFEGLGDLSLGPNVTEIKNDSSGWLCHSAMIRNIRIPPSIPTDKRNTINIFKVYMTLEALDLCLRMTLCEEDVVRVLQEKEPAISREMVGSVQSLQVIATSLCAIIHLMDNFMLLKDEPPRCLAIIETTCYVYEAGMTLLASSDPDAESEFGSPDIASNLLLLLEAIKGNLVPVQKNCSKYANQPHLRRADYLLRVFHHYISFAIGRLSQTSGVLASPLLQQTSIHAFFGKEDEPLEI